MATNFRYRIRIRKECRQPRSKDCVNIVSRGVNERKNLACAPAKFYFPFGKFSNFKIGSIFDGLERQYFERKLAAL